MSRPLPRMIFAIAALAAACGGQTADPRPQWVVAVSTDAPVPQLGDRLLVELVGPDGDAACTGCRRLFGMAGPEAWPLSFGIPDPGGGGLRLRVRLFRADHSDAGGSPFGALTIDAVGLLPATRDEVRRVSLSLFAACAGVAADVVGARSCDPESGALVPRTLDDDQITPRPVPGSFASARKTPCSRPAPDGMVCVEGGLLARGSARFELDESSPSRSVPERLVRLSPFAMDRTEMTVRAMRDLVRKTGIDRPVQRSADAPVCTYTLEPGDFEDYPVNCITRARAVAACAARAARLPTEAEWEFAAGDRDRENRYPWGADPDACSYAIVGRARVPAEGDEVAGASTACRLSASGEQVPFGPRPVTEGDDVNDLGLRHMGGNVGEWVADQFAPYDSRCSDGPPVLVDPRCDKAEEPLSFLARGGSWNGRPYQAQTTQRATYNGDLAVVQLGFRCAESL